MNDATTETTAGPVRRRLGRLAGAVAVVVGLGAGMLACDHWRQQQAWREACAEADRLDPGWRWKDLTAGPPPADAENSIVPTRAAARLLSGTQPGIENGSVQLPPQQRPSTQYVHRLRDRLAALAPALAESRQIADYPDGRIALPPSDGAFDFSQDPLPMDFLAVTRRLLYAQFVLQIEDGDLDAALMTLRAMVYLTRPLVDCPVLMDALVASACRVYTAQGVERLLAQGGPSDSLLDDARRMLEPEAGRTLLLAAFRGERAFLESMIRGYDDGRVSQDQLDRFRAPTNAAWTGWPPVDRWLSGLRGTAFRRPDAVAEVRHLTWMIERLKESPDGLLELAAEWTALRRRLPRGAEERMECLANYVPQVGAGDAQFRCAVVALAAEQFRRAAGRWPTAFGELVPRYLTMVPHDPFDGQPLKLARHADGLVIYSVGTDGKDDGGDVGVGSRGRDVGVRLWDVQLRRRPPLPKASATENTPGMSDAFGRLCPEAPSGSWSNNFQPPDLRNEMMPPPPGRRSLTGPTGPRRGLLPGLAPAPGQRFWAKPQGGVYALHRNLHRNRKPVLGDRCLCRSPGLRNSVPGLGFDTRETSQNLSGRGSVRRTIGRKLEWIQGVSTTSTPDG